MNRKDRRILMKKGKIEQFAGEINRLVIPDDHVSALMNFYGCSSVSVRKLEFEKRGRLC